MKELELKYGCNPNQKPARVFMEEGELPIAVLNGRPGYINLLDALNALDTPYVNFAFTAPGKPCLLTPLVEIDGEPLAVYKHVIMLMRLPQ